MIKDYKDIESVITETYEIKREQRGIIFSKTVETEKLIRKRKENYKNGILFSFEEMYQNFKGDMMRIIGEKIVLPNGESKEVHKSYNTTTNKLVEDNIFIKDKHGNTYLYTSHDYESNFIPISSWKYENFYSIDNKLIQRRAYCENDLNEIRMLQYNNKGYCIKENRYYYKKGQNYKDEIIYNSFDLQGNCIREETIVKYRLQLKYLEGKDSKTIRVWKRNEYGDVVHTERSYNGNISNYTHELKYDYRNNCIEDRCYMTGTGASDGGRLYRYAITYSDNES